MPITWRTWDRALTGAFNGAGATATLTPITQSVLAALYDLSSESWTPEDFAWDGGCNWSRLDDPQFFSTVWQRKDRS